MYSSGLIRMAYCQSDSRVLQNIVLDYSDNLVIFSSDSCFLDSIADCMMMNCSSDLFYVLLVPFIILKIGV